MGFGCFIFWCWVTFLGFFWGFGVANLGIFGLGFEVMSFLVVLVGLCLGIWGFGFLAIWKSISVNPRVLSIRFGVYGSEDGVGFCCLVLVQCIWC